MTSLPQINQDDYYNRSYEDISKEFQTLFPSAIRAFQLVPLMYNRLTLVDNLSHSTAVERIYNDHHHMPGFSRRSITRYLPADNPAVPHRVTPSWRKKSPAQTDKEEELSNYEQYKENIGKEGQSMPSARFLDNPVSSMIESENLKSYDVQEIKDEKQQLAERLTILQELHTRDIATIKDLNEVISNGSFVVAEQVLSKTSVSGENILFEFYVGIEEIQLYLASIANERGAIDKLWINGYLNKDTGKIVEIHLGRIGTQ